MADAKIRAIITAEDRASATVEGFGMSVKKMATSVAIGELAVQGINTALQKFQQVAQFAVSSAADFEQNRIAFETMLGSAEKAKKMLKEVSDFAAKTPFELPEVVTGAKQLLAYNIEAEKIIPTFKALGNIAAGVGKDKLPQLILAFGQVKAATRLTGMELRQFTEAGVPMLSTLAKQLGKTEGQIQDMVSEGKIGFKEVEKALFGMSEEGGKFFNLMDRQSHSFSGVMSNISDAFGRTVRNIVGINDQGEIREGSIFDRLSKGAQGLLDWINAHQEELTLFFTGLVNGIVGFGTKVAEWVGFIIVKWNELQTYLQNNQVVQFIFKDIAAVFDRIYDVLFNRLIPNLKLLWKEFSPQTRDAIKLFGLTLLLAFDGGLRLVESILIKIDDLIVKIAGAKKAIEGFFNSPSVGGVSNLLGRLGNVIGSGLGVLNPFIARRAEGGPVTAGQPYIVGERRPELFVPSQSGTIIPKVGGGGATYNVTVQAGAFMGNPADARRYAELIADAMRDLAGKKNMTAAEMLS